MKSAFIPEYVWSPHLTPDEGYLKDLAIIDMDLRYMLVQMAFDIEHYTKIELLHKAEDESEDGYAICSDFMDSLSEEQRKMLLKEISRNENSVYCGDMFDKYRDQLPMWVSLELIPFGRLVSFYGFCVDRYSDKKVRRKYFMLKICKNIRNASAHSSCIMNDFSANTSSYKTSYDVINKLAKVQGVSKNVRECKMSNARI